MTDPLDAPGRDTDVAREIADDMATLYEHHFGRAPNAVRTLFPTDDIVLVVLEGSMTPAEQRLVEDGHAQELREQRLAIQQASAGQFRRIVETATGRGTVGFTSAHDVDADIATEVFVLGR